MKLQETKHSYYCNETNYYIDGRNGNNHGRCDYESWQEFKENWLGRDDNSLWIDDDYNHVFRFDIKEKIDEEDNPTGKFELWLFFMLQRKGIYRPVWVKQITEADMPEIEEFLRKRWEYIKNQWIEYFEEATKNE